MPRDGASRVRDGIDGAEDLATPEIREFPALDEAAYVGLPGEIVRTIEPHTESDPAGLLLSCLAYFGNCVGRGPHYRVENSAHAPNLYVVKVGDSAKARKGTGEDRVRSLFLHVDEDWVRHRFHSGLSSGEGVIWAVRDPVTGVERDKKTGDTHTVVTDAGEPDKRLLVVESEFSGVLRVMGARRQHPVTHYSRRMGSRRPGDPHQKLAGTRHRRACLNRRAHNGSGAAAVLRSRRDGKRLR